MTLEKGTLPTIVKTATVNLAAASLAPYQAGRLRIKLDDVPFNENATDAYFAWFKVFHVRDSRIRIDEDCAGDVLETWRRNGVQREFTVQVRNLTGDEIEDLEVSLMLIGYAGAPTPGDFSRSAAAAIVNNAGPFVVTNAVGSPVVANWQEDYPIASAPFDELEDAATIVWDFTGRRNRNSFVTLEGDRTLSMTGLKNGANGLLLIQQDTTGGRDLTFPATSIIIGGGGTSPTLSPGGNAKDMWGFAYTGANIIWSKGNGAS